MEILAIMGGCTLTILVIAIIAFIIAYIKYIKPKNTKGDSKSSFVLSVDDDNLDEKYNNLSMKRFNDIGGLHEVKEELRKYVKCFDSRDRFHEQNVNIPKGILLYGPPGCGKTSLAKAIAYEARVNFICKNASDLINESFSMSSTNNIEKLFEDARALAPCIVFIDELDVIGSRYSGLDPGAHQVEITRLLAELDGFQNNSNIMVIAASNDISRLDTALLRSGRLGKKYYVGPPTSKKDILEVVNMYIKDKNLSDEVNEDVLVTMFNGKSPADIMAILNECGVMSILNNTQITVDTIRKAAIEVDIDTNLGNLDNVSLNRRKTAARHESGHAIVSAALGIPVQTITILGTSTGIRGMTISRNGFSDIDERLAYNREAKTSETVQDMFNRAVVAFGGLATELIEGKSFKQLNLGSDNDICHATSLITSLISRTNYIDDTIMNIGMLPDTHIVDINVFDKIKEECKLAQDIAVKILKENTELLDTLSKELEEKITISDANLDEILCKVKPWNL